MVKIRSQLLLAWLLGAASACSSSDAPAPMDGGSPSTASAIDASRATVDAGGAWLADAALGALDAGSVQSGRDGGAEPDPSAGDAAPSDAGAPVVDAGQTRRPRPIARGQVTGPITGGGAPTLPLSGEKSPEQRGFVVEELYLAGKASSYVAEGTLGIDGKWGAKPDQQADYVTRLVVLRPAKPEQFNGTVILEWLNVTGQVDTAVGYVQAWEELLRGGYGYVGVTVQKAGVDALTLADGARYAKLVHPGDTFAYDIFAQAGAAIGWPSAGFDAFRGQPVARVVAYGESQSAMRMITQVNAIQPLTHVFDGIIVHSRAGWGAPVGTESDALVGTGQPVHVRDDSDARVIQLFTESELFLLLGPAYAARQPDTARLRTYEIAGAAHADKHMVGADVDLGCGPINDGPQHFVVKSTFRAMHQWLAQGIEPPYGAPLAVNAEKSGIARDANGIAQGGVRTPAVDAPIAQITGEVSNPLNLINPICMLTGATFPFTPEQLKALYPTHADYVAKVTAAAAAARAARFVLPEEEAAIVAAAQTAAVP